MHPSFVTRAAQLAVTAALVMWMTAGFTRRPGLWMRWKMFCRGTFTIVTLTGTKDGHAEPMSAYAHLSPGSFLLSPARLQAILDHLIRSGRYDRIDGNGRVLSVHGEQPLEVDAGQVKAGGRGVVL